MAALEVDPIGEAETLKNLRSFRHGIRVWILTDSDFAALRHRIEETPGADLGAHLAITTANAREASVFSGNRSAGVACRMTDRSSLGPRGVRNGVRVNKSPNNFQSARHPACQRVFPNTPTIRLRRASFGRSPIDGPHQAGRLRQRGWLF